MYKRIFLSVLISLPGVLSYGQQKTYTLQQIITLATDNNPSSKQKDVVKQTGAINEKLLSAALMPELNLLEQNTYQSEVTSLDLPGVPKLPKDNYNLGLDFRYPLTQFGTNRTQKEIEAANTSLGLSKLDIDLQHLRERVVNAYGNLLLQKENKDVLLIRKADLEAQRKKVAVGVASGAVLKSNQLVFESEILTTDQRIEDTNASIIGLTQELSILTAVKIDTADNFQLPADGISDKQPLRPEMQAFKMQADILELQKTLIKQENKPRIYISGQGVYGRPGYNFLDTSLRPYGTIALGISFNIKDALTQSKHLKLLDLNKEVLQQQQNTFNMNLQASLDPKKTEISKYENIISRDEQIVNNRKEIIRAANSQLENGVITSTEYLTELNAENNAQLNLTLHKVQLALAVAQYNTLLGL